MALYENSRTCSTEAAPTRWCPARARHLRLDDGHARALLEIVEALRPDYPTAQQAGAMLYAALFGSPPLSAAPRPTEEEAHAAMAAYLTGNRCGALLWALPCHTLAGLSDGLQAQVDRGGCRR